MDWQTAKDQLPAMVASWLAEEMPGSGYDELDLQLIVRKHFKCQAGRIQLDFDGIAGDLSMRTGTGGLSEADACPSPTSPKVDGPILGNLD
jgi:hypothetical protein